MTAPPLLQHEGLESFESLCSELLSTAEKRKCIHFMLASMTRTSGLFRTALISDAETSGGFSDRRGSAARAT